MRLSRTFLVSLVLAAFAFVACGGDDDKGTATPRATATTTEGATSTTEAATTADAAALEPLLITEVPAGYVRQADDVGDTGPSDLEKAISDDGEDDARAVLTKAGFVAGYQRLWQTAAEDQIIVFLYQFKDTAGAGSYEARTMAGSEDATPFTVAGIPDAKAFQLTDSDGAAAVVFFVKGPYLVQLVNSASGPAGQTDLMTKLATAQYQRLPGTVA